MLNIRALLIAASLSATPAIAGKVSLDTALKRSELVVMIQLDTPYATKVAVPVPAAGEEKECAPYLSPDLPRRAARAMNGP